MSHFKSSSRSAFGNDGPGTGKKTDLVEYLVWDAAFGPGWKIPFHNFHQASKKAGEECDNAMQKVAEKVLDTR